jgi:signal transduction histidine kinase
MAVPPDPTIRPTVEQRLARRDRVLAAVVRCAEILAIQAPWRDLVPSALAVLGEATGVSRVYIFEVARATGGRVLASQRFEWCAAGVTPQIDMAELQGLDLGEAGYQRWIDGMEAGEPVFGDVEDFPASEQPLLQSQDILSLLVQPIQAGARWWGFVGFDACAARQAWDRVEVDVLRIAARVLGTTIHQQERDGMMRRAQKMEALGRMAGGIAHDFKNVLMILSTEVEALRGDLRGGGALTDDRDESIDLMEKALDQAAGLTRRLLDFSRQREGRAQRVALDEALRRMEPLLRQAAGPRVRVDVACDGVLPVVVVDPVQFEQVVLNLVVNARDAMPDGGDLGIGLATAVSSETSQLADDVGFGEWVVLTVRDSGVGMSKEVQERIFDPFFTTKAPEQGTGLGLATTYSIMTSIGGHIAVASEPRKGAEFRLYFPAAR